MNLPVIQLDGSYRQMGESFGEQCREEIRQLCDLRIRSAQTFASVQSGRTWQEDDIMVFSKKCMVITEAWDRDGYAEFLGIARGAGIQPWLLHAMQGLTDIRDYMAFSRSPDTEGCSAFVVGREKAERGHLLAGQSWDLLTDNMSYVRLVHRRPAEGPETISLTLTGCLTLIGLNGHGLAVGTTNLRTKDAGAGIHYLHILHCAIRCKTLEEVGEVITNAPRMAAHYYFCADNKGNARGIECSALQTDSFTPKDGMMVHCNHILSPKIRVQEEANPTESSCFRQKRMEHLLAAHPGRIGVEALKTMLGDHEGGDLAICRHDVPPDGVSTNACVIMSPETGEIHACRGQAHIGEWQRLSL